MYLLDVLDGAMVILAISSLNIFHPGIFLSHVRTRRKDDVENMRERGSTATLTEAHREGKGL